MKILCPQQIQHSICLILHEMEADAPPLDRFVVFSILEDLSLHPVPHPHDLTSVVSKFSVPEDHEPTEDSDARDDNLLTAGSSGDPNDEPAAAKIARCKAMTHLAVLSKRLGPHWTNSELVRYLIRCVEEDDADLAVAVARVVPHLVTPYPGLSKAPVSPTAVQQLLSLSQISPLLVALASSSSEEARELCILETIPRCFFGISFESFANLFTVNSPHYHRDSTLSHHLWAKAPTDVFERLMRQTKLVASLEQFQRYVKTNTASDALPGGFSPVEIFEARMKVLTDKVLLELQNSKWIHAQCSFVRLLFLLIGISACAERGSSMLERTNETLSSNTASRIAELNVILQHLQTLYSSCGSPQQKLNELFQQLFVAPLPTSKHQDPVVNTAKRTWRPILVREKRSLRCSDQFTVPAPIVATLLRSVVWLMQGGIPSHLQVSASQWISLFGAVLDSRKGILAHSESEETIAYKKRHDDSLAGSHFSVLDAVHHGLIAIMDAIRTPAVEKEHAIYVSGLCESQEERWVSRSALELSSFDELFHSLFHVIAQVFERGANYSQWKSRLLTARQGPEILRHLLLYVASAVLSGERGKWSSTTSNLSSTFTDLIVQRVLNNSFAELLSGDCEEEVRSESVMRIATIVQSFQKFHRALTLTSQSSVRFYRSAEESDNALVDAADAAMFCIEQTSTDACDRVRSSAATAITKLLLCFVTVGGPRDFSQRSSLAQRGRDVLITLLQDASFVVQLSVIGQIGDLLVANSISANSDMKRALHADVCLGVTRLLDVLRANSIWRVREKCALMCSAMFAHFYFRGDQSLRTFALHDVNPVLMELLFDPVKAVRDACLANLVSDLRSNVGSSERLTPVDLDERQGFINNWLFPAILNHPKSHTTYLFRSSLIAIALAFNVDHETHLLPLLDKLSRDSVINVRLVVASSVGDVLRRRAAVRNGDSNTKRPTEWEVQFSDEEVEGFVLSLLRKLVQDPSTDVRERASKALKVCL